MVITQIWGPSHFFIADCLKNNEIGMIEIPLQSNGNGADQIVPRGIFEHFHPKRRQKQETCEDLGWLGGDNFLWDMTFIFFSQNKWRSGLAWWRCFFFIIFILFIYFFLRKAVKILVGCVQMTFFYRLLSFFIHFIHLMQCPTIKQCERGALVVF